ncbi:urotensin-2B isoform X1 [Crocuta crocuta]
MASLRVQASNNDDGNELFPDKEDANHEELLLALLNKNFDFQRPSNIDTELASKLEERNQLENLKEQLSETEDPEISYAIGGLSSSHPNKRACFWKYCV